MTSFYKVNFVDIDDTEVIAACRLVATIPRIGEHISIACADKEGNKAVGTVVGVRHYDTTASLNLLRFMRPMTEIHFRKDGAETAAVKEHTKRRVDITSTKHEHYAEDVEDALVASLFPPSTVTALVDSTRGFVFMHPDLLVRLAKSNELQERFLLELDKREY